MIYRMDLVKKYLGSHLSMKGILTMELSKVKEYIENLMISSTKVCLLIIFLMDMERLLMRMEIHMQVIGRTGYFMVRELISLLIDRKVRNHKVVIKHKKCKNTQDHIFKV